jgi:hypothetical protein
MQRGLHALALLGILLLPARASAAQEPPAPIREGHSAHGEAFNEGPRQAAYLMPNPGSVHFPVTSSHPDVQPMFDQGVGQLHGFWYYEAERSFRQVAAWDPDCALADWGKALANVENEERAAAFARAAREACERRGETSARERMYVDAWARFYDDDDGPDEASAKPVGAHKSGAGAGNGKGEGPGAGRGAGPRESAAKPDAAGGKAGNLNAAKLSAEKN